VPIAVYHCRPQLASRYSRRVGYAETARPYLYHLETTRTWAQAAHDEVRRHGIADIPNYALYQKVDSVSLPMIFRTRTGTLHLGVDVSRAPAHHVAAVRLKGLRNFTSHLIRRYGIREPITLWPLKLSFAEMKRLRPAAMKPPRGHSQSL